MESHDVSCLCIFPRLNTIFILTYICRGGGDEPEDLLSGLVAARRLDWRSHVRLSVVITDAPAHGYAGAGDGDDYPSGRCPDQTEGVYPSFAEAMSNLALTSGVDTLFCKVTASSTNDTIQAIASVYPDNAGFGTMEMTDDEGTFREQLIGSISHAIVSTITEVGISGLQTVDGITLSALMASINSSVRESLAALDLPTTAASTGIAKETSAKAPESDFQRLQRELELNELNPVRIALGLPLFSDSTLSLIASRALLLAGCTAQQMEDHGYPPILVKSFQDYVANNFSRI
jgi:hypothetical protein